MEENANKPLEEIGKEHNEQENSLSDFWFASDHFSKDVIPEMTKWGKNSDLMNVSAYTTDYLGDVNRITSNNKQVDSRSNFLLEEKESAVDKLMETVDLSDLSFSSYNDFILGDCTCFEDATEHVDPAIHVDGAPLSFNNSNPVQLFKDNTSDMIDKNLENYRNEDSLNLDHLLMSKSNSDDCQQIVQGIDDIIRSDNYNFYHIFELLGDSINHEEKSNTSNEGPKTTESIPQKLHKSAKAKKEAKTLNAPIRKGRRYLPNFKQKVLDYTSNHTFKETASHFHINCNTLTEWSRESKRLSLQNKSTTSMRGSVCNYKTDIVGTPVSKTEIIFLNDEISLETEHTETLKVNIEEDLPPCNIKSDESFLKWIQKKRLEKKELIRNEVYNVAKHCFKKCLRNNEKPIWFITWFKRFNKTLQNSEKPNLETEKYIMYPNHFKLEVALYARNFTKNSAARIFNVPRRRMFDWFNLLHPSKDTFLVNDVIASDDSDATGKDLLASDLCKHKDKIYTQLQLWYRKSFLEGVTPTSNEIKCKAKEVYALHGITDMKFSEGWLQKFCQKTNIKLKYNGDDHLLLWILAQFDNNVSLSHPQITEKSTALIGKSKDFKGSKGWTLRFLKRHSNFLQHVPTVEDKLPSIAQSKVDEYCKQVEQTMSSLNLGQNKIGCMDEVPLNFSSSADEKSASLPLLRKTGFEHCQAVVMLCTIGDGRFLPPAVIFKGNQPKQLQSNENGDILIFYQQDGVVDCNIIESWLHDIWMSCIPGPNILIADSFEPHCSARIHRQLTEDSCIMPIIPEGCSSRLQPLSTEIIPKFLELINKEWKQYHPDLASYNSKPVNKCQYPDQDTILRWVRIAYKELQRSPISIINSFKITGLLK